MASNITCISSETAAGNFYPVNETTKNAYLHNSGDTDGGQVEGIDGFQLHPHRERHTVGWVFHLPQHTAYYDNHNNTLFVALHLVKAWRAYKSVRIRSFYHTHINTHCIRWSCVCHSSLSTFNTAALTGRSIYLQVHKMITFVKQQRNSLHCQRERDSVCQTQISHKK